MTCHAVAIGTGATCCLSGREAGGPSVSSCGASREGVPPAHGCTLFAPDAAAALARPFAMGSGSARPAEKPISRSIEPADPVPLRLS